MIDFYNQDQSVGLRVVRFQYLGCTFEGRGLLEWKPKDGGELHAFVEQVDGQMPKNIEIGRARIIKGKDRQCIHMRAYGGWHRIAVPGVALIDRFDVVSEKRLSIRFGHAIFSSPGNEYLKEVVSAGHAMLRGEGMDRILFPDSVETQRRFPGNRKQKGWSRKTVTVGDPVGARFVAEQDDAGFISVQWSLKRRYDRLGRWWKWPQAFRDALSILSGSELQIVQSQVECPTRTRMEITRQLETTQLGILAPVLGHALDREDLRLLTRFLYTGSKQATVAAKMFRQLAEASRQRTDAGVELLTATVLEAALRTLFAEPFVAGQANTFDAKKSLNRFARRYLDQRTWQDVLNDVHAAWQRLRHRNAHPDWLYGSRHTDAWNDRVIRDLQMLSQFYGAMILAMAGKKDPAKPAAAYV